MAFLRRLWSRRNGLSFEPWLRYNDIQVDGLTLAFGGGTALGAPIACSNGCLRTIDLRIIGEKANSRGALKRLRGEVKNRLQAAGFTVEGHYASSKATDMSGTICPMNPLQKERAFCARRSRLKSPLFPFVQPPKRVRSHLYAEAKGASAEAADVACVRWLKPRRTSSLRSGAEPVLLYPDWRPRSHPRSSRLRLVTHGRTL